MRKVLMIGDMHFMDAYNFDFQRVQKCAIHYLVPDEKYGVRVIPFCTHNNFHRQQVERRLSVPLVRSNLLPDNRFRFTVRLSEF